MYTLTENRRRLAEPILASYGAKLRAGRAFDTSSFERELRGALGLGLREFKDIIRDVFEKHAKYRRVAAYYMQHGSAPGPASEFKPLLARLYRVRNYDAPERKVKQRKYWGAEC